MYKGRYPEPETKSRAGQQMKTKREKKDPKKKNAAEIFVDRKKAQRQVMLFSKTHVPECKVVKEMLQTFMFTEGVYEVTEIEKRQDVSQIENYLQILCLNDKRTVPQLFIQGKPAGGYEELIRLFQNGQLKATLKKGRLLEGEPATFERFDIFFEDDQKPKGRGKGKKVKKRANDTDSSAKDSDSDAGSVKSFSSKGKGKGNRSPKS